LSLPSLFLVGIYLGYLFFRFRSIYLTMLSHFLYNSLVILLANYQPKGGVLFDAEGSFRPPVVGVSALLFALTVLAAERLSARSRAR